MASSPSPASSAAHSRHGAADDDDEQGFHHSHYNDDDNNDIATSSASVPVETLVEHLLAAKRSLSSVALVLRANDLTTHARHLHEESVILSAQTAFLARGIHDQRRLLARLASNMNRTYNAGKREFSHLIKTLDAANGKLEETMQVLQSQTVDPVFRPEGEEPKNLLDFVDETQVGGIVDALKASIAELQATQTSFDGDLLRFENDMRLLKKTLAPSLSASPSRSPAAEDSPNRPSIPDLLQSLTEQSHSMAEHLVSLNRHFDMCVTAVRITEGGTALARRKAAEDTGDGSAGDDNDGNPDPVSISGLIAQQETNIADLDSAAKSEIVHVVVQDAPEVYEVVNDLHTEMQRVEADFALLTAQVDRIKSAYTTVTAAFHVLEDIGSRIQGYIAAETEFVDRWEAEKDTIFAHLDKMEDLREFYQGYASAYDSLILEVKRRAAVEDKIQGIWRKAKEAVDKLVEADSRDREMFREEVGAYIPTDLWVGASGPLQKWEIVRASVGGGEREASHSPSGSAEGIVGRQRVAEGEDSSLMFRREANEGGGGASAAGRGEELK